MVCCYSTVTQPLHGKRIMLQNHPASLSHSPCSVCEWYPSVSCQCQGVIQRAVTSHQPALVRPFAAALADSRPKEMWTGWGGAGRGEKRGEIIQRNNKEYSRGREAIKTETIKESWSETGTSTGHTTDCKYHITPLRSGLYEYVLRRAALTQILLCR